MFQDHSSAFRPFIYAVVQVPTGEEMRKLPNTLIAVAVVTVFVVAAWEILMNPILLLGFFLTP